LSHTAQELPFNNIIEGKVERRIKVKGKRGGRRKKLLDDLKEKRGYWKLKEETLDVSACRTHFERCYGPVMKQPTE
jgi:hypothetical protein